MVSGLCFLPLEINDLLALDSGVLKAFLEARDLRVLDSGVFKPALEAAIASGVCMATLLEAVTIAL